MTLNIGSAQVTEFKARSRRKYNKWEKAREEAYNGSVYHFLNALIDDKLEEEGFLLNVIQYDSVMGEYTTPLNPPPIHEIVTIEKTDKDYLYILKAKSDIEVTYKGEYEDNAYKKLYRSTSERGSYKYTDKKVRSSIALTDSLHLSSYQDFGLEIANLDLFQKSVIFFLKEKTLVSFPGQFIQPRDVLFSGWWRWGALSDWLPLDYRFH